MILLKPHDRKKTFTLTEISEICGFQSQSYFTRLFRENTGETPGEYRRKILTI